MCRLFKDSALTNVANILIEKLNKSCIQVFENRLPCNSVALSKEVNSPSCEIAKVVKKDI